MATLQEVSAKLDAVFTKLSANIIANNTLVAELRANQADPALVAEIDAKVNSLDQAAGEIPPVA